MRNIKKSGWEEINCVENGKLLSIEKIHEKIWEIVGKIISD